MGVENPYIKKASCFLSPQKPCALMSTLALSCLFAVLSARVSLERGCSSGSVPTLGHTSVSSFTEGSLISLLELPRLFENQL